ncbi:MFS transporter, partial [Oleiphilus sp. HI0125]
LTAMFIAIPVSLVDSVGLSSEQHWWLYLLVLVGSFIAMIPLIIVGETKQKMKPIFCVAIILVLIGALAMSSFQTALSGFIVSLFVFFMGFNLLEASLPSLVSKISPAGSKGTAMGVYSTSQFFGAFCGGLLGGVVLSEYGVNGVYYFSAALLTVWFFVAATMKKPKHERTVTVFFKSDLDQNEIDDLGDALISIQGVEDAVVVSEGVAYLKVISTKFEEASLEPLKKQYPYQS